MNGSSRWCLNPEVIAIQEDARELIKLIVTVIFASGTNTSLMEKLNDVFSEDELQNLAGKLATLNADVPTVCDDDRWLILHLIEKNKKEKEFIEKEKNNLKKQV